LFIQQLYRKLIIKPKIEYHIEWIENTEYPIGLNSLKIDKLDSVVKFIEELLKNKEYSTNYLQIGIGIFQISDRVLFYNKK